MSGNRLVRSEFDTEYSATVITLDRPNARNALNSELAKQASQALQDAAGDDRVRSVILTGAGDRAFCAGADIEELLARDQISEVGPESALRHQLTAMLETMPKPSIAAINGHAIGGGLELALACTIRLCVPKAKLGLGEINLGIMPGNGGTQRLTRLIGMGRALEMVLTGQPIDGHHAERIGLVNTVVEPDQLMPRALALAAVFASKSRRALAAAKDAVLMSSDVPLAAGLAYENKWFAILNGAPDKTEGVLAFKEKRTPKFE